MRKTNLFVVNLLGY